jgi:hypothetical protein
VSNVLKIEFSNKMALEHFKSWLCEQGEQNYWVWQECREQEEDGDITAIRFDYSGEDTIKTICGRLE